MPASDAAQFALMAITRHGAALAARLAHAWPAEQPAPHIFVSQPFAAACADWPQSLSMERSAIKDVVAQAFARFDQLVFFVSIGAVVRLIAPHLRSKEQDPGVIVVDDAGQYVIPVLSGHIGAANAWAQRIAALLQATAVLTTASDVGQTIAVDILGRHLGWRVQAPKINLTRVSAQVVDGQPIAFVQEAGSRHWWTRSTPLPANIELLSCFGQVRPEHHRAVLWVTHAVVAPQLWQLWHERLVVYRPPLGQNEQDRA